MKVVPNLSKSNNLRLSYFWNSVLISCGQAIHQMYTGDSVVGEVYFCHLDTSKTEAKFRTL